MCVAGAGTERLVCALVDRQVSGRLGNTPLSDMRQFTPSLRALARQMINKAPGRENVSVQSGLTAQAKSNGERQKQEVSSDEKMKKNTGR